MHASKLILIHNSYICGMFKANIQGKIFKVDIKGKETFIDGKPVNADMIEYAKGKFHIILDNRSYTAEIISINKELKICEIKVGNSILNVSLRDKYDELLSEIGIDEISGQKINDIKAPMPGMVLQVMVANGQTIKKGDAIVVLEAMKMENILKSPADGIIRKIHVSMGDKVEKNQVMVNLD